MFALVAAMIASAAVAGVAAQGPSAYTIQATSFQFNNVPPQINVGDSFVFDLGGGAHNAISSPDGGCTPSADLTGLINANVDGDSYIFTQPGTYYFICTFGSGYHCQQGMTASVTVVDPNAGNASPTNTNIMSPTDPGTATMPTDSPVVTDSNTLMPTDSASITSMSSASSTMATKNTTSVSIMVSTDSAMPSSTMPAKSSANKMMAGSSLAAFVVGAVGVVFWM
ncbi:hypothetical protein HDU76_001431 [Blyttiomyces sp. JEL0837]|nr:hypothetical protein HDU76_001431 [Blyttiomyces sp. JEL0837]